jgi:hypothetical protein
LLEQFGVLGRIELAQAAAHYRNRSAASAYGASMAGCIDPSGAPAVYGMETPSETHFGTPSMRHNCESNN